MSMTLHPAGCTSSNDGSVCCVNAQLSAIPVVIVNSLVTGDPASILGQCRSAGAPVYPDLAGLQHVPLGCMRAPLALRNTDVQS